MSDGQDLMADISVTSAPDNFSTLAAAEQFTASAWAVGLRGKTPDLDTPYWKLGINANRALQIFQHIWLNAGIDLPVNLFVEAPTIRKMAGRLHDGSALLTQSLVRMRDGDERLPPLFLFPGGGGFLHELTDYACALEVPGIVYGVPSAGMDGTDPIYCKYEDEAARAAALIQDAQETGPYFLAGYSMGGCAALETARILKNQGKTVHLILLDTGLNDHSWPFKVWTRFMIKKVTSKMKAKSKAAAPAAPEKVEGSISAGIPRRRGSQIQFRFRNANRREYPYYSMYWQPNHTPKYSRVRENAIRMKGLYKPAPYDGEVIFFLSNGGDVLSCSPLEVWPRYLRNIEWVNVPGTHSSMLLGRYARHVAAETSTRVTKLIHGI